MEVITQSKLGTSLLDFQERFNNHKRVKKLLRNWERSIFVEATDTNQQFTMVITDRLIDRIEPNLDGYTLNKKDQIFLQAEEAILVRIFSGDYNPASAHIDGALAIFSGDRDKVKLEAISMVIWGLN